MPVWFGLQISRIAACVPAIMTVRDETTKTDRNGYGSMSYPVPNIPITDHLLSNSELV